jgi:hypothetical protein
MAKKKGAPKTGGRVRGTPNKVTRAFREAVSLVFDELGGTTYLVKWAKKNPTEFFRIASRLVPPGSPIAIGPLSGSIADQGKLVLGKMSEGVITPEQASTVMHAIAAQARIIEVDELERRVAALEGKQDGKQP